MDALGGCGGTEAAALGRTGSSDEEGARMGASSMISPASVSKRTRRSSAAASIPSLAANSALKADMYARGSDDEGAGAGFPSIFD